MNHQFSPAVEQLIQAKMASGQYASEDELLLCALRTLEESEADLRAIADALHSFDQGERGVSLDEAFQALRAKFQIPG
jgi:Arc/MetJ-type ribon-helix-helix transcriptional regulator